MPTLLGTNMTKITGNAGGAVQQLIEAYYNGKDYAFVESVVLASQAIGSLIAVARIPVPFVPLGFTLLTDTSLATATVAIGNAGAGNSAIYKAAGTFTTTDTPTLFGKTSAMGVPVFTGYDSLTGNATGYASGNQGGAGYEDICLTTAVAALPAAGNLRVISKFMLPA